VSEHFPASTSRGAGGFGGLDEEKRRGDNIHPEDTKTIGCSWKIAKFVKLSGASWAGTEADGCIARRWVVRGIFGVIFNDILADLRGKSFNDGS
jgi:hypothetical protein